MIKGNRLKKTEKKRWAIAFAAAASFVLGACNVNSKASDGPSTIRLDYAHYAPTSLVLHQFGWVEEEFEEEGIEIEWVFSQGSNRSLEFLNSNSVDFGSTAGAAALISASNGAPIQSVYVYSQPEWTALVTTPDSSVQSIEDLPGSRIAATLGTDPYIFLLRALDREGIDINDVEIISQQHSDGAQSLINGHVDAWAGLDPIMARLEVEHEGQLFYREAGFNTYGFLNVRNAFAENHPDYVERIIELYEEAREWIVENPDEAIDLLVEETGLTPEIAEIQYERNNFSQPVPGNEHHEGLIEAGLLLQKSGEIDETIDIEELVKDLINAEFAEKIVN